MDSLTKKFYRPDEIAQLFGVSRRTIYRLIHRRKLSAIKVGRSVRVPHEELQRLKKRRKNSVRI
jgi:putative molybdopterin biosynthesis protein